MFLITALFLLLIPSSILAKSIPRADATEKHQKRFGCLDYYHMAHELITFTHPTDHDSFDYAIFTRHDTYYPQLLRYALSERRFQNTYLYKDKLCGWNKAKSVDETMGFYWHLHRGDIYWKYSDLRWVKEPKHTNDSSHWEAADETHIPPFTGPKPPNGTINAIELILKYNDPAGDVYEIATVVLGYAVGFSAFIWLLLLTKRCAERGARSAMPTKWDDDNGIELDAIKGPDTDSPHDAAPKYSYEDPRPASTSSTDTLRSEPLPIYSVDGAGR